MTNLHPNLPVCLISESIQRFSTELKTKDCYVVTGLFSKIPFTLFISADNRWHFPCRDWSRGALLLRRLDSVACSYPFDQRINSFRWRIPRMANKEAVHPRTEWHPALCIVYVCGGTVLRGWSDCSLHDHHVSKCLLWRHWRSYNHSYNIHFGVALH